MESNENANKSTAVEPTPPTKKWEWLSNIHPLSIVFVIIVLLALLCDPRRIL